jgi:hypothetical protein
MQNDPLPSKHDAARIATLFIIDTICNDAGGFIADAILAGKRLPITKLSEDIGKDLGVDKVLCYHIISKYISARGDLRIKMGPRGGIEKI